MISFKNDYNELAHPVVLQKLLDAQGIQFNGYGLDVASNQAKSLISKHISIPVDIHFLIGGTNANKTIINHVLRPYEAVIATDIGHIQVHETGAIEANGNKILLVSPKDGKLTPVQVQEIVETHADEHMVIPKMVYISNTTEIGSIYSKSELEALYKKTKELGLWFFIDGARLGAAIVADPTLSLDIIASLCDVFYIGGTKNGAMFGEAAVITNPKIQENFRHSIKRNGGLLAKGFVTGLQFEALFENDCYFTCAKNAIESANYLKQGLHNLHIRFFYESMTNQQFIYLPNETIDKLAKEYAFEIWIKGNQESVIRLVTSWATKPEHIDYLLKSLQD